MNCSTSLWRTTIALLFLFPMAANAQLIFQENFEGDDSNYELFDDGWEDSGDSGPATWGLNVDAERIGLLQAAPAKRAAILWSHAALEDDFTQDALDVFVATVGWAADGKANAKVGFMPDYEFAEGSLVAANALEAAGYQLEAIFDPLDADPNEIDVLIHSSEQASTAFANYAGAIVSYSAGDHDDTAIAGIGETHDFLDPVVVDVPPAVAGHPALGGKEGSFDWTTGATQLEGIGKLHNGGTALAFTEHPITGDPTPALFVVDEGAPVLGAFNPDPEGDRYIVGAALNKFGEGGEKTLTLNPVDVSGQTDVRLTVDLAATAADFENGDYLFVQIDPDGDGPKGLESLVEYYGDGDAESDCFKGLSDGEDCLPTEAFGTFSWPIPNDATNLVVHFAALTTWGNEIVAIDNIRIHSGELQTDDLNGDGQVDVGDIDLLAASVAAGSNEPKFDIDGNGLINGGDLRVYVKDTMNSWIGDANGDGEFNSSDFVSVFTAGKFEQDVDASWSEGDWNGDNRFNSSDFVAAFTDGGFELGPRPAAQTVPEPTSILAIGLFGFFALFNRFRKS